MIPKWESLSMWDRKGTTGKRLKKKILEMEGRRMGVSAVKKGGNGDTAE